MNKDSKTSDKKYQPQQEIFFDDGREIELLHYVYGLPDIDRIRGSPAAVVAAIDSFAQTKKYLMNVGDKKGRIVTTIIAETKPQIMVELGGYVGYSALLFGDAVRKAGGQKYYSLERNPEFGAVIMSLVDLAGLRDIVEVIVGPSSASLRRLCNEGKLEHIDMLFLDHWKPLYTTDLKICESLGLVGPGSIYVADNCVNPGNPPYLRYVRSTVDQKLEMIQERNGDALVQFPENAQAQYLSREGKEHLPDDAEGGNPRLQYQSEMIMSYEPTGIEVGLIVTTGVALADKLGWDRDYAMRWDLLREELKANSMKAPVEFHDIAI